MHIFIYIYNIYIYICIYVNWKYIFYIIQRNTKVYYLSILYLIAVNSPPKKLKRWHGNNEDKQDKKHELRKQVEYDACETQEHIGNERT